MKRLFLACLFLLLPATGACSSLDSSLESVVKIYHTDKQGLQHQCTAFAVDPVTLIAARHCLGDSDDEGSFDIVRGSIKGYGTMFAKDDDNDLIAIRSNVIVTYGIPICKTPPTPGDTLYAIGFPHNAPRPVMFMGPDLGEDFFGDFGIKRWLGLSIIGGMSGGPIVTQTGCVVSVNQLYYPEVSISFGVNYHALTEFVHQLTGH